MIRSIQNHHPPALPCLAAFILASVAAVSCHPNAVGQVVVTSSPPAQVVIVTNAYAFSLTKHPNLPVLYLTEFGAPGSTNLLTVRLHADGSLVADSQRSWPDYLTTNPTTLTGMHERLCTRDERPGKSPVGS